MIAQRLPLLRPSPPRPRSKMLDMYAREIARLLAEGHDERAELTALAIPHIAMALANADLQSSRVAYAEWCSRWVKPDFGVAVYQRLVHPPW